MVDRLALVIGSQCDGLPQLPFIEPLAVNLDSILRARGGWTNPPGLSGPLLNPTVAEMKAAVKAAFDAADSAGATLLLAFLGHGITTSAKKLRLLALDSPPLSPDADTSFDLVVAISDRLEKPGGIDGLIVLVDACEAGPGTVEAAAQWPGLLRPYGRLELLVASDDQPAYNGCFTETLVATFAAGLPLAGTNLRCNDLVPALSTRCPLQLPQHFSYTVGAISSTMEGDPGLWLVPNNAHVQDAVAGQPSAGTVDQLSRGLVFTPTLLETLTAIVDADSSRLRVLVGPPGSGKSTIMAVLIRPSQAPTLAITSDFITAAVFLDATSTVDSLTADLIGILARVPGFDAAREAVRQSLPQGDTGKDLAATEDYVEAETGNIGRYVNSFQIDIALPLARCRPPGRRIRLIIDGLDQPTPGAQDLLAEAIHFLTREESLDHVRVIAGVRANAEPYRLRSIRYAHRIIVSPPTEPELLTALSSQHDAPARTLAERAVRQGVGGWLIARLIHEIDRADLDTETGAEVAPLEHIVRLLMRRIHVRKPTSGDTDAIAGLLVAVGIGPSAPLRVVQTALSMCGHALNTARLRDLIADLGALVARGKPGQSDESVGIAHESISAPLEAVVVARGIDIPAMHKALLRACDTLLGTPDATDAGNIAAYRRSAAPRHYHESGDDEAALRAVEEAVEGSRPVDNEQRSASWLATLQASTPTSGSDFVVVSSNLPAILTQHKDGTSAWKLEYDGIASALKSAVVSRNGAWVGWFGRADVETDPFILDEVTFHPVPLTTQEVIDYQDGFCDTVLRPLYHDAVGSTSYGERNWWVAYVTVNRRFAEAAAVVAAQGATVWIHDYELQLVPKMLRMLRPDLTIGFFLHTPFPPVELFMRLPYRTEIVEALLGADLVGFQLPGGAQNFLYLARRLAGQPTSTGSIGVRTKLGRIQVGFRSVGVGAFPASIPAADLDTYTRQRAVRERAAMLRAELGNPRSILLSVDRADEAAGIEIHLAALEELLTEGRIDPQDFVLVQIIVANSGHTEDRRQTQHDVESHISRINGEFGRLGCPVIHYYSREIPSEELLPFYVAADVMVVTPLRGGMHLTAKEYVACHSGLNGALVLSEFTGSAAELRQAFLCNPYDSDSVKDAIFAALNHDSAEMRRRMRALRRQVLAHDADRWAQAFVDALTSI